MQTKNKGLSFVAETGDNVRFTYLLEGRRVMDIVVDTAITFQPEGMPTPPEGHSVHPIFILMVDAPMSTRQSTKGFAVRSPYVTTEAMGYRVDGRSVAGYVQPRLATLLARVFVPAA